MKGHEPNSLQYNEIFVIEAIPKFAEPNLLMHLNGKWCSSLPKELFHSSNHLHKLFKNLGRFLLGALSSKPANHHRSRKRIKEGLNTRELPLPRKGGVAGTFGGRRFRAF